MSKNRYMVRFKKKPKGIRKLVIWSHHTDNSSWWGEDVVFADSPEEAVERVAKFMDFDKHTRRGEKMTMRVYDIPTEYQEFKVGPSFAVEKKP